MNRPSLSASPRSSSKGDIPLMLGLALVLIFFVLGGAFSFRNVKFLMDDVGQVAHTHDVITALDGVLSIMKDAETGQRGFVITGDDRYLEPYLRARAGIDGQLKHVAEITEDNADHQAIIPVVQENVAAKIAELDETIQLRRDGGFEAARLVVAGDKGKTAMDELRAKVMEMRRIENQLRQKRVQNMKEAYRVAVTTGVLAAVLGVVLSIAVAFLLRRASASRQRLEWLQAGRMGLANAMLGEQRMEQLGQNIVRFLAKYLDAHAGVLFFQNGIDFHRAATYGVPADSAMPERFQLGDGLLGRAAVEKTPVRLDHVPEGYFSVGSALGRSTPRHLLIAPAVTDNLTNAVLELGFVHPLDALSLELLNQVSESIAMAVKSANYRENLQLLLEETQRQAEELQAQSEELRVSNEELEEQSRALKESQSRLEQQQAELEQTNSQLEEQAQLLEVQRNDLSRANEAVQIKANELERSSRYKSDFLANMSHELRTPLNSLLILSKLLADNTEDNLTAEQVNYARTIQSSGNDLLVLINDILDLSKIEAGHMEIHAEPMPVARLVDDLERIFAPVAGQKGLKFSAEVTGDCPELVETDRQRIEQILKNLLSNALKFTEEGSVTLRISQPVEGKMAFTVLDTGIGISEDHQRAIFEAFHQADGTISRRYGGTGLGLSISRQLARLLGGVIEVTSVLGEGSAFTLVVPQIFRGASPAIPAPLAVFQKSTAAVVPLEPAAAPEPEETAVRKTWFLRDDRETLTAGRRTILVVEDDEPFARALCDMVRELHFQCLLASTAEEALIVARQYLPSAVLLDVGLPDNSGLTVLDRLKQDTRTRHIPVHVVSASDYAQTAYSLGAVGYMLKPVKLEDLMEALRQIGARLSDGMRRVLIVEDDTVQRESLAKLLGSHEVETVEVGTATECLERLKESTFDCMVLDLSLPDASGFTLLETLSREHSYSFPPVIVYTGHELSGEDEQKLRRYSKSIIIKGAKSPERLLDEVTLFLHQVVAELPPEQQVMLKKAHNRDAILEGRRILIVEDDVRNIYSLTNILEPRGAVIQIARNGREALDVLEQSRMNAAERIDLVLMDVMMPEMDGLTATREIRKQSEWNKLPVIMLTAKAMRNDQERCLEAGANDYMAKPLDVEKLLSLVRVWMPR